MPLNIEKYTKRINIWPMIKHYILNHSNIYNINFTEDEFILKFIKQEAKKNLPPKEYDTFRKGIDNLYTQKSFTLKRENIYRLCFALNLPSDKAAQDLCINYLHENELSPRSLDEFIIICALRLHLSWEAVLNLRDKYNQLLHDNPIAPIQLVEGTTRSLYQNVVSASIHNEENLNNWLSKKENLAFFARTRNTHYFALFNDMDWNSFASMDFSTSIPSVDTTIKLYQLAAERTPISIQTYFLKLFGLHSIDDENIDPTTFLTDKEISLLSKKFPNVFMTYDTFCDLVQRKRSTDISSGTYLLRVLEEMDPTEPDDSGYIDFTNKNIFIDSCNSYLTHAGLPTLNMYDPFDALVLDVYSETLEENPSASSIDIKAIFFAKLRKCLKEIAVYH